MYYYLFISGEKLKMMNASLDLEFTKMHDESDEKEGMSEDPKVIVRNEVTSPRSASIAKNHPSSLIISAKRVSQKRI